MSSRRILAVVLPELLNELGSQQVLAAQALSARQAPPKMVHERVRAPGAVVLTDEPCAAWDHKTRLDAVNASARRLGVFPRQTIEEAHLRVEHLSIRAVSRQRVTETLKQLAEVALGFGAPVSFQGLDTIWVDITGSSHLFESERALAYDLVLQIKNLGYSARAAVSSGPWLARAFARYGRGDQQSAAVLQVAAEHTLRQSAELPIIALPMAVESVTWFSKLGLLTLAELRQLPTEALASRLVELERGAACDENAPRVDVQTLLDLIRGQDESVLTPYQPEPLPAEEAFWDEPLATVEPLLFVLKSLSHRLGARLEGRGQAASELELLIFFDRSIALMNGQAVPASSSAADTRAYAAGFLGKSLAFKLPVPLVRADELERVVRARLQRETLDAPARGLSLKASSVTQSRHAQLDLHAALSSVSGHAGDPQAMATLVAELSSDLGVGAVGLLRVDSSHLLEKSCSLVGFEQQTDRELQRHELCRGHKTPTRLLSTPICLDVPLRQHELVVLGARTYVISEIDFDQRLEAVEWWEPARIFRDYYRIWLSTVAAGVSASRPVPGLEALAYHDRENGQVYLQALFD